MKQNIFLILFICSLHILNAQPKPSITIVESKIINRSTEHRKLASLSVRYELNNPTKDTINLISFGNYRVFPSNNVKQAFRLFFYQNKDEYKCKTAFGGKDSSSYTILEKKHFIKILPKSKITNTVIYDLEGRCADNDYSFQFELYYNLDSDILSSKKGNLIELEKETNEFIRFSEEAKKKYKSIDLSYLYILIYNLKEKLTELKDLNLIQTNNLYIGEIESNTITLQNPQITVTPY